MKLYRKINFRYLIILLFFRNGKIKKRKKGFLLRLILRACDIGISYSREIRIRARYNRIIIYFDTVSAKLLSVFATQIIHGCCYCAFLRLSLSLFPSPPSLFSHNKTNLKISGLIGLIIFSRVRGIIRGKLKEYNK